MAPRATSRLTVSVAPSLDPTDPKSVRREQRRAARWLASAPPGVERIGVSIGKARGDERRDKLAIWLMGHETEEELGILERWAAGERLTERESETLRWSRAQRMPAELLRIADSGTVESPHDEFLLREGADMLDAFIRFQKSKKGTRGQIPPPKRPSYRPRTTDAEHLERHYQKQRRDAILRGLREASKLPIARRSASAGEIRRAMRFASRAWLTSRGQKPSAEWIDRNPAPAWMTLPERACDLIADAVVDRAAAKARCKKLGGSAAARVGRKGNARLADEIEQETSS
ncbi:MAG: hypothetical protein M3167_02485 [Acidobacteriota bacterium]|nr:hypothetical protein [Acidobacteriota bacterium]